MKYCPENAWLVDTQLSIYHHLWSLCRLLLISYNLCLNRRSRIKNTAVKNRLQLNTIQLSWNAAHSPQTDSFHIHYKLYSTTVEEYSSRRINAYILLLSIAVIFKNTTLDETFYFLINL